MNLSFNAFLMRLIYWSHWPPWPCRSIQTCFPHFSLKLLYPMFTSTHLSPYTASMQRWMSMGGIFSPVENWITAHYLNRTSSQPSILTCTEWELWIVVGSRLCMVEVRCHVTVWNWFYLFFFTPLKNMTRANFQPVSNISKVSDVVGVCV